MGYDPMYLGAKPARHAKPQDVLGWTLEGKLGLLPQTLKVNLLLAQRDFTFSTIQQFIRGYLDAVIINFVSSSVQSDHLSLGERLY